jgi:ABC-type sugar transport system ATPase subunit
MALVPEDRRGQAGVMEMSIRENATLTSLHSYKLGPFIANGRERAAVRELVGQFGVKSSSIENPLRELSGGNQQKVIIGKWVHTGADIYIFDEPTQGVDVGAKREIFQIIEDLADSKRWPESVIEFLS